MVSKLFNMIMITYSSKYAMNIAEKYWTNTTITHRSMDEKQFDFYFSEIEKIIKATKCDKILDYGGGNGEIAYRFLKKNYKISHCDINIEMVNNAKSLYSLQSCLCTELKNNKYNKIIIHNALFYIHPHLLEKFLENMYMLLENNGELYLTDSPDFDKRENLKLIHRFITFFLPVYQPNMFGFFIKHKQLKNISNKLGFNIKKLNSWSSYRSHWILTKDNNE